MTAADGGAYRVEIDTEANYGSDDRRRWKCQATVLVKPTADGWLSGPILPEQNVPAPLSKKPSADEERTNPDTLERDHAMLIVNRLDDVFAEKRPDPKQSDKPKCRRVSSDSSTARLFPAKPSPDIDNLGGAIR